MNLTLGEIARRLGVELEGDASIEISSIANLVDAEPGQLSFLFNSAYKSRLSETRASAVVLRRSDLDACPVAALISRQPRLSWAQVAVLFDPLPKPDGQHHPSAVIAEGARIGKGTTLGPNVVVESGAVIEPGVTLGAGCYVGEGARIGEGTRLFANVTLYHGVTLGKNCLVHSQAVIGADGFGFEFDHETRSLVKIPQVYSVRIGDNVEIGAGTTIDRGALADTVIGDGVKIDNQVQIGHGVQVGAHTAISGCTAVAGSTKIGSYCLIGGGVGIVDNIEVADRVEITAMTLVSQSIVQSGRYSSGTGLMTSKAWKRSIVGFGRLDEIIKRIRRLETK